MVRSSCNIFQLNEYTENWCDPHIFIPLNRETGLRVPCKNLAKPNYLHINEIDVPDLLSVCDVGQSDFYRKFHRNVLVTD